MTRKIALARKFLGRLRATSIAVLAIGALVLVSCSNPEDGPVAAGPCGRTVWSDGGALKMRVLTDAAECGALSDQYQQILALDIFDSDTMKTVLERIDPMTELGDEERAVARKAYVVGLRGDKKAEFASKPKSGGVDARKAIDGGAYWNNGFAVVDVMTDDVGAIQSDLASGEEVPSEKQIALGYAMIIDKILADMKSDGQDAEYALLRDGRLAAVATGAPTSENPAENVEVAGLDGGEVRSVDSAYVEALSKPYAVDISKRMLNWRTEENLAEDLAQFSVALPGAN